MNIEVKALDIEGRPITARNFGATLEYIGVDGTTIPASPGSIQIVEGVWFGQLNLPESSKAPLQLRMTGPDGVKAETTPIETIRILPYKAGDLVWDTRRQRLYASLRSTGNGEEANQVVALDPTTGEILARVPVASDPMKLAMTSGGEFLYAALDGSAKIARIDLETFTEESTFRVGSSPTFGLLYAGDMQTVENQPNRLIVCRVRKGFFNSGAGVVVFNNGETQSSDPQIPTEIERVEPSADPNIFFGYTSDSFGSNFRILKLTETGLTEESSSRFPTDGCCTVLRSEGNRVFGSNGTIFDGRAKMILGRFSASGEVCPNLEVNRVFFIEPANVFGQSSRLAAMDATTHARIGQLTLPSTLSEAASLIRWGKTGLAFRASDAIAILRAGSLIPTEPPADLQMNVSASEPELTPGQPIVYTIEVSNLSPNPVAGAAISARFTNLQSIQHVEANEGIAIQSQDSIDVSSLSINAGAKVTFKVTALPKDLGSITCIARVHSPAIDPVPENDSKVVSISVGYHSTPNSVHVLPISGLEIVQDPTDGTLLISGVTSLQGDESTARSVIRVNPMNGRISHSIALSAQPSTLALSSNGRYLYAGLDGIPAIERVDMSLGLPDLRIPLGVDPFGNPMYAEDIEVIAGDGTSFITSLMQQFNHLGVAVFDGATRRPQQIQSFQGSNLIEPTSNPNLFVGLGTRSFNDNAQTLQVDETGVRETRVVENLAAGSSSGFASDGDLMLTGGGNLFDGPSLSLLVHLTTGGQPLVDAANGRAYMLSGNTIYAYDTTEFTEIARFELGTETPEFIARRFIRWGMDGFAILDQRQSLILVRWSEVIPPDRDQDRDGLADRWEAQYFGTLGANPEADPDGDGLSNRREYDLGTSPTQANPEVAPRILGLQTAPTEMLLRYERTRLVGHQRFDIQQSPDLASWTSINDGAETVESAETRDGTARESVRWVHPPSTNAPAFFRVRWLP